MHDQDYYDQLISRYLSGDATPDEQQAFNHWLEASDENKQLFEEARHIWQMSEERVPSYTADIDEDWDRIKASLNLSDPPDHAHTPAIKSPRTITRAWQPITGLAAAVLIVFAGVWFYQQWQDSNKTATTGNGQTQTLVLTDGSQIRLNAASTITYPTSFSDSLRQVFLEGEAFFDVATEDRPFEVRTAYSTIRVLGTSFNVRARDEATHVVVKEGRVVVRASNTPQDPGLILEANQMSIQQTSDPPEAQGAVNADERLGWLEGALVFDQAPLGEIAAEIERHYDVNIEIAEPILKTRQVTATFRNQPMETVLSAVCRTLNLSYIEQDGVYRITR